MKLVAKKFDGDKIAIAAILRFCGVLAYSVKSYLVYDIHAVAGVEDGALDSAMAQVVENLCDESDTRLVTSLNWQRLVREENASLVQYLGRPRKGLQPFHRYMVVPEEAWITSRASTLMVEDDNQGVVFLREGEWQGWQP